MNENYLKRFFKFKHKLLHLFVLLGCSALAHARVAVIYNLNWFLLL